MTPHLFEARASDLRAFVLWIAGRAIRHVEIPYPMAVLESIAGSRLRTADTMIRFRSASA